MEMKYDFEGKVKEEMAVHWDMDPEVFDAFRVGSIFGHGNGWAEVEFIGPDGTPNFFIEVNSKNEVWNFDWIERKNLNS